MTRNQPPAARILAASDQQMAQGVVRIEYRCDTDIDDLWSAITEPGRLARWYGQVEGDLRIGGKFRLDLGPDGERIGSVMACEPPQRILATIRETDESWRKGRGAPPYNESIEARLTAEGDQTILVIEVQGMPLDTLFAYGAGWQIHVEHLADYIAGRDFRDAEARWAELEPAYRALAASVS